MTCYDFFLMSIVVHVLHSIQWKGLENHKYTLSKFNEEKVPEMHLFINVFPSSFALPHLDI